MNLRTRNYLQSAMCFNTLPNWVSLHNLLLRGRANLKTVRTVENHVFHESFGWGENLRGDKGRRICSCLILILSRNAVRLVSELDGKSYIPSPECSIAGSLYVFPYIKTVSSRSKSIFPQ